MTHRISIASIDPGAPDTTRIRRAADLLRGGALVAYPTDTVYGLGADPRRPDAVARLFAVKGRAATMAIPLIAGDVDQVRAVGELAALARRLAAAFWPGPLTLIVRAHDHVDRRLLGGGSTVAVRIPDHPVARSLARELAYPITATSANRSGEPACRTGADVVAGLGGGVALVLDGGASRRGGTSTIVDVSAAAPTLVREGVVPWDRVLQSLA